MLKYEELWAEIRQHSLDEQISLLAELTDYIETKKSNKPHQQAKQAAKVIKITDFDPTWRPHKEGIGQNEAWLSESENLAEKIGQSWPKNISAVDAIREDRREL